MSTPSILLPGQIARDAERALFERLRPVPDPEVRQTPHNVIESPHGPLLVYEWADGELLHVSREDRDDLRSPHQRFRSLPPDEILQALDVIFEQHAGAQTLPGDRRPLQGHALGLLGKSRMAFRFDGCLPRRLGRSEGRPAAQHFRLIIASEAITFQQATQRRRT